MYAFNIFKHTFTKKIFLFRPRISLDCQMQTFDQLAMATRVDRSLY